MNFRNNQWRNKRRIFLALGVVGCATSIQTVVGQPPAIKKQPSELKPKSAAPPPAKRENSVGFKNSASPSTRKSLPEDKSHLTNFSFSSIAIDAKSGESHGPDFTYSDERESNLKVTGNQARYKQDKIKKLSIMDVNGNLILDDDKHHVTADKAHVDDSEGVKLAVITGNVVIVLKPKPELKKDASDSAKQRGKGATITCDKVDDYYKKEFVIFTGHFVVKQLITKDDGSILDRTVTADHAEYDGKLNMLHLFAPVDYSDSDKQELHCVEDAFVGTKEGEETFKSGHTKGKILREQDKPN